MVMTMPPLPQMGLKCASTAATEQKMMGIPLAEQKIEKEELASVELSANLPAWTKSFREKLAAEMGWLE